MDSLPPSPHSPKPTCLRYHLLSAFYTGSLVLNTWFKAASPQSTSGNRHEVKPHSEGWGAVSDSIKGTG